MAQDNHLRVVTSIKPLTLLVKAVAPDSARITTLVPPGASPHTYQMRPSDRRALARADFIFWVGPELETFLQRLLSRTELAEHAYALMPPKAFGETNETTQHHGHAHGQDPHVWLDPAFAREMTASIHHRLSEFPGIDQQRLNSRLDSFNTVLTRKETSIRSALQPVQQMTIFTYHDAFRRFAAHYGLRVTGTLTSSPEKSPGARHLNTIQKRLRQAPSPCLMAEPQFNRDWWQNLTDNPRVRLSTWDPLASGVAVSSHGYIRLQQAVADALLACASD